MEKESSVNGTTKGLYSLLSIIFGGLLTLLIMQAGLFVYDLFTPKALMPTFWGMSVSLIPYEFDLVEATNAKYSIIGLEGSLIIYDPGFLIGIISHLVPFIVLLSLASIVYLLRKIIRTVYDGNPFVSENSLRIRKIALLIILVPLSMILLRAFVNISLPTNLVINKMYVHMQVIREQQWSLFMIGLIFLLISEVFRIGVMKLEEKKKPD